MAEDRAVIAAELDGAGRVVSEARKVGDALASAKKKGEGVKSETKDASSAAQGLGAQVDSLKSAFNPTKLLGGAIGGLVLGTIGAAVSYLKEGAAQARDFGDKTANAARRAGTELGTYRDIIGTTERETLQSADAQSELVNEVQRMSYGGATAAASLRGVAAAAAATGKDVREFGGVIASLQDGLGIVGDVSGEIDRLMEASRRLGTVGGPDALLDTIAALRPAFSQVSTEAAGAAAKLEAFAAVASKKLRPDQARSVVANAIGTVQARAYDIQRATGVDPLDEEGNVKDPLATLRTLRDRALKQNRTKGEAVMGLSKVLDARTARFVLSPEFDQIEGEAKNQDKAQTEAGLQAYLKTPEGVRRAREVREEQRQRTAGASALKAQDELGEVKEAGIGVLARSFAPPSAEAPPPARPADPLAYDPSRLGGGGQLKIEFPAQMADQIGAAVAKAQRDNPPILRLPANPNDGKVQ